MKLTKLFTVFLLLTYFFSSNIFAQRNVVTLEKGWKFLKSDAQQAESAEFDDSKWENVTVPHDWAIFGPFDRNNDLQNVAITQNFETQASVKTGRTGGLPYVGIGWYRTTFNVEAGKETTLVFDGAMSEARVYVNGQEACFWPLGYNSFHCDVTSLINKDGKDNVLAVRLENRPQSSRWYPGAGLYRNVHVVTTEKIHVPVWGTQITTPYVGENYASVNLRTEIKNTDKKKLTVISRIYSPDGKIVAEKNNHGFINHGQPFTQNFIVNNPLLWSPEEPNLYKAVSEIYEEGVLLLKEGTVNCASKGMEIIFTGTSAHASQPEKGKNPAFAVSDTVLALKEIADPACYEGLILATVVQIDVGERAFGVSAHKGKLLLTIRGQIEEEMDKLQDWIEAFAKEQAHRYGLEISFNYYDAFPETFNHKESIDKIRRIAEEKGWKTLDMEAPIRSSEDFGHYLKKAPGALIWMGAGFDCTPLHSEDFDYNDRLIERSVDFFCSLL